MNFTLKLDPTVTLTEKEGQTVLFSRATGDFYGLNPTATYLVQKLLKSDFARTTREAAAEFQVEETQIQTDLKEVVADLVEARLAIEVPVA